MENIHDDLGYPGRPVQAGPLRVPPTMHRYLGAPISQIRKNAIIHEPHQNHCAHFVCHIMAYDQIPGAAKCSVFSRSDYNGVHIRVNEVFNWAPSRQVWAIHGELAEPSLVVATIAQNVNQDDPPTVGENRRKHIGLYTGGLIWHYSTESMRVFADHPAYWRRRMTNAYSHHGQDTVLFLSAGLLRV